jgi:hypothetical protein
MKWLQQRPEQLQFEILQHAQDTNQPALLATTAASLWVRGCECLVVMDAALMTVVDTPQPGCCTAALAAALLRQLEQSGACL